MIQAYFRKEKSQIKNLTLHLKQLEKEEQTKVSRRKEIIKIRAEINKIEPISKKVEKINETTSCFFAKINKIDKSFMQLIKKKRKGPSK